MEKDIRTEGEKLKIIWETQMMFNDPYKTCQELKYCEADPNPKATPPELTLCHQVRLYLWVVSLSVVVLLFSFSVPFIHSIWW